METAGRTVEHLRRAGIKPRRDPGADERLRQLALEEELRFGRRPDWTLTGHGRVVVDEVGLGAGLLDRLTELGYRAEGFNGGRSPGWAEDRERFLNLRAEAFWTLRRLLEEGEIAIPPDEHLWDELTAIRWKLNSAGKIQIEPKDGLRQRLGRSPDRADAVAMCFYVWNREREDGTFHDPAQWPPLKL